MFDYQKQDSTQTLSEGIAEYFEAHQQHFARRTPSPEAQKFFHCHDVSHIVFGCDISLRDELVVKISSFFGTTAGLGVLKGYSLAESKEIYEEIHFTEVVGTAVSGLYLIPRTIWRCLRMSHRWPWDSFEEFLDVPLVELREMFGVKVAH